MQKKYLYYPLLCLALSFWIYQGREFFVEQYLRFALRKQHIVVSLSTTPYRIGRIFSTLDSICNQNVPIAKIYLSIPHKFKRDNLDYVIPSWLAKYDNLTILRTNDYGPATKLLGLLADNDLGANTIIITVDDDITYPRNTILHLAYAAMHNPHSAVGLSGADIYAPHETMRKLDQHLGLKAKYSFNGNVTILQGYAGIAYHKSFFADDVLDVANLDPACVFSDDIYFSFYLAKKNITRRSLANSIISLRNINPETSLATSSTALQNLNPPPVNKNLKCIAYLRKSNPLVNF